MTAYSILFSTPAAPRFADLPQRLAYTVDKPFSFAAGSTLSAAVSGDTVDVITIPANTLVLRGGFEITTADTAGNSGTLALATVSPATTLLSAATVAATGLTMGTTQSLVTSAATTTARVTVGTGAVNAVGRVILLNVDLSNVVTTVN